MKKILILLYLLININHAFGMSKNALAVVRGTKGGLVEKQVNLQNLLSDTCLVGEHFKIVQGNLDDPICFDLEDKNILLKAVTTYHHLSIARDYFITNFAVNSIESLGQVIIRIDMDRQFNNIGHFGNKNLPKEFNNALSIPKGVAVPEWGIEEWGNEIWFRPAKKVKVSVDLGGASGNLPGLDNLGNRGFKNFFPVILTAIAYQFRFNGYSASGMDYSRVFDVLSSMAVMETAFRGVKGAIKMIGKRKATLRLDTAFIPEIIYHEFAHLALSDRLKLTHSTSINEGLADYFAAAIGKNPHLAKKIKKYSKADGKNGKNKTLYNIAYEMTQFANVDFVLGVFWSVRLKFPEIADKLIYNSVSRLKSDSNIKNDLLKALLNECRTTCKNPISDRYKLYDVFRLKGF